MQQHDFLLRLWSKLRVPGKKPISKRHADLGPVSFRTAFPPGLAVWTPFSRNLVPVAAGRAMKDFFASAPELGGRLAGGLII